MDDTDLVGVHAEWCAIPSTVGDSAGAAEMRAAVAARLAATGALIRDHPLADGTHALVGTMRPQQALQLQLAVPHLIRPQRLNLLQQVLPVGTNTAGPFPHFVESGFGLLVTLEQVGRGVAGDHLSIITSWPIADPR